MSTRAEGGRADTQTAGFHVAAALPEAAIPAIAPPAPGGATPHRHGPFRLALDPCVDGRPPAHDDFGTLAALDRLGGRTHALGVISRHRHRPGVTLERLGEAPVRYLLEQTAALDEPLPAWR